MEEQKIVMEDSPEAAVHETRQITGWFSRHGHVCGNDENHARYLGSTHRKCPKCEEPIPNNSYCHPCWDKKQNDEYQAMPIIEWDEKSPICLRDGEEYFFSADDLYSYCDNNEIQPQDLQLVLCKPIYAHKIDEEDWIDDLPEEGEIPDWLIEAIDEFNNTIKLNKEPLSYTPGNTRVKVNFKVEMGE